MQQDYTVIGALDAFIRKYYKNRMIKGLLYAVALLLSLFILVVVLEHFGYFGSVVRGLMFWAYLAVSTALLGFYVVVPLLKMHRLGKVISYDEAARIVGRHFPEVSDKLLNLLQLQQSDHTASSDLLQAAIRQKTEQLKPIPFVQAVDLRQNRKYLKWALIPLLTLAAILLIAPKTVIEPSKRLVHYTTHYERPAPFRFVVENEQLEAIQQEDFILNVRIEGEAVPNEAFIVVDGNEYRMQQLDKTHYQYLFKTLRRSLPFHLHAAGVQSVDYQISVLPKPSVLNFQALLSYPAYTAKPSEVVENDGNLTVPQGTIVRWSFQTQDADTLYFIEDDKVTPLLPDANGRLQITRRVMASSSYGFSAANRFSPCADTLRYAISSIADALPMIAVIEMRDSAFEDRAFFQGRIKDDYGFSKLDFKILKTNSQDTSIKEEQTFGVALAQAAAQEFNYSFNLAEIVLQPGDRLEYYFEVWDNDGINGPKRATSQHFEIKIPSADELDNLLDRNAASAREQAETSMSDLKKLQEEINDLMRKMVDKKDLNWQDKKALQELSKKQNEVKEMLSKMQQQLKENSRLEQKYKEQSERLMQKQQELDKLFNDVLNEEMKQMMQEMDKLMQELDKKNVQQELEKLKLSNEELEKQLDQDLELMKRLELEKKVEDAVHKAEKLADKQRKLAEETEAAKGKDKEQLMQKQQQLNNEFNDLKQDLNKIQQDYKKIDKDIDFKLDKDLQKSIEQKQQEAKDQIQKGKNGNASQQQKSAADDMEKLSEQIAEAQQDIEQGDLAEDSEMIRRLLKSLVTLSFNQESLIGKINATYIQDPQYQQIIVNQNKLKDDYRNVEDSLRAIAQRQMSVALVIDKEISSINSNLAQSLSNLLTMNQSFYGNSRNTGAAKSMQYTMTSFNSLALVLAESLDKMQSQMRQNQQKKKNGSCKNKGMQKKSGSCSNPGKGKPSAKSMKEMQDELNKQMQALKKQLDKQGNKPGRQRIGEQGSARMSEQFAKMAAQQEMIRRMMQEYGQEMKQQGAGNSKLAKEIDQMMRQMEQTETDLVNKTITQQTITRQQQIMTRMLEHEKAEMQREKEQRRESREGVEQSHQPSPAELEKFKKLQEGNTELFRTVPPALSTFYKNKVNDYFYNNH